MSGWVLRDMPLFAGCRGPDGAWWHLERVAVCWAKHAPRAPQAQHSRPLQLEHGCFVCAVRVRAEGGVW